MVQPRFCSYCGGPLGNAHIEGQTRLVCINCGRISYQNPIPCVVAIVEQDGAVLLVQRAVDPQKGKWCLPGGFIEVGETVRDAVVRELKEETGLQCQPVEVLGACSDLGGFYGDILIVCYQVQMLDGELAAGDDAMALDFFREDDVPQLAFRCHAQFLKEFWRRTHSSQSNREQLQ